MRADQIDAIRALSVQEIHELALGIGMSAITVQIAPQSLDTALCILKTRNEERELILTLIRAGAHFPMMNALFGLSNLCFSNYRKLLNLSDTDVGRPKIPTDRVQEAIWTAWLNYAELNEKQRYLAVYRETRVPLRNIWSLIQEWDRTGLTPLLDPTSVSTI